LLLTKLIIHLTFFSEGELEEVLTTYTKINKSASIFLGGGAAKGSDQPRPATEPVSSQAAKGSSSDSQVKRRDSISRESASTIEAPVHRVTGWEDPQNGKLWC